MSRLFPAYDMYATLNIDINRRGGSLKLYQFFSIKGDENKYVVFMMAAYHRQTQYCPAHFLIKSSVVFARIIFASKLFIEGLFGSG